MNITLSNFQKSLQTAFEFGYGQNNVEFLSYIDDVLVFIEDIRFLR